MTPAEAALRYVLKVRPIECLHTFPGPDEVCARCVAEQALEGVMPGPAVMRGIAITPHAKKKGKANG